MTENPTYGYSRSMASNFVMNGEAAVPTEADTGMVSVSASVTVVYALES